MKVAVVGGGLSGLAVAHALATQGAQVMVLEATARTGGVIRSVREEGFLYESGPNTFLDREPATRALIDALGLAAQVKVASPAVKTRYLYTGGALRKLPGSPPAFLKSDVLPLSAKLRAARELFSRRGPGHDESLAAFARRHLGREVTEVLVDAMQTGIYAGDPERMSVEATFPQLAKMEREHRSLLLAVIRGARARRRAPPPSPSLTGGLTGEACTFEGGMEGLIRALDERLGDSVQRRVALQRLSREGQTWRLAVLRDGRQDVLEADKVVLATPAYVSAELVRPLDAGLAGELAGIRYAAVATVHLGFSRADANVPAGFGFLAPEREGRKVLGCIFASSVFPHRAPEDGVLLTCLIGGARHPERVELDEAALVSLAREELSATLGVSAAPRLGRAFRWLRGIPQYEVGHLSRLERIDGRLAGQPGLSLIGNAYRGVGVNDCIREAASLAGRIASGKA